MAQEPPEGQGLLIVEGSRHTQTTNTRLESSGRGISPMQSPIPDNPQQTQETNAHVPGWI